jgi:hypothetical protein
MGWELGDPEMNKILCAECYGKQLQICNGAGQILVIAACAGQLEVLVVSFSKICLVKYRLVCSLAS